MLGAATSDSKKSSGPDGNVAPGAPGGCAKMFKSFSSAMVPGKPGMGTPPLVSVLTLMLTEPGPAPEVQGVPGGSPELKSMSVAVTVTTQFDPKFRSPAIAPADAALGDATKPRIATKLVNVAA